MCFGLLEPSLCATFQRQSTFDNVTRQTSSFKFITIFGWTLSWALRKQNNRSEWSSCSRLRLPEHEPGPRGDLCAGGSAQASPSGLRLPKVSVSSACSSLRRARCGQVCPRGKRFSWPVSSVCFTERERLPSVGLRRVVRSCCHPESCPGQWGNVLSDSVAGRGMHATQSHGPFK